MKVLVTGAGGFIGRHLVSELLAKKHTVVASDLVQPKGALFGKKEVTFRKADITNAKQVEAAAKGCGAVIHIAGIMGNPDYDTNYAIHVTGTKNVVSACKKHKIKRILFYSTITATRDNAGAYGKTKKLAEEELAKSGLDVTVFQPTIVFGKGGKGLESIVKQIRSYPLAIPVIGTGKATRQPISVSDMARLTVMSLSKKKSFGKTYIAAGGDVIAFRDLVKSISQDLGVSKMLVPIPKFVALPMAACMQKVLKNPPFTVENVRGLTVNTKADISSLKTDIGFTPTPLKKSLSEVIKDF